MYKHSEAGRAMRGPNRASFDTMSTAVTIDRKTLLEYDPLPGRPVRRPGRDRLQALLIALIGTPMVLPVAALGTSSPRALVLYAGGAGLIGCGLMLTVWLLGFRDGGLYGAFDRLRYPLANWADFGPTGRRFINHDDHWYWKRLAIAWLWFWMWLAIPVAYGLR